MATAVLDLEFEQLPPEITGLKRYSKALILIRVGSQPVGQTTLPVIDGRISGIDLHEALLPIAVSHVLDRRLYDYLAWDEWKSTGLSGPLTATVAVCTRDRPEDIRRCLDALIRLPDDGQEILVVDNAPSTEATRQIVERYPSVRYVRESRPGLNVARNRALREAQHDIVAFTDDDAASDPGWLRALIRNFADPLVLCVTGLTMPLELETEAQEWQERHSPFGRGFSRRIFDNDAHPLAVGQIGAGVNMAVRRSVLDHVGAFDEALDAGTRTCSGGDSEMFVRILCSGYRIVYDPGALCWHRHRRTWKELRHALHGYGVGVYACLTQSLFVKGELSAPLIALAWLRYDQLPALIRSLCRRPNSKPLDLILAELSGCVAGPWAYLSSRRRLRKRVL